MFDQTNTDLTAETSDVMAGLKFLKRVMDSKIQNPILGHVLFPGDGTMRATNLDQEGIWKLRDGHLTAGHAPFTVAHKALMKLMSGADKGALVTLTPPTEKGGKAGLLADGMQSKLATLPAVDFPTPVARQLRIRFHMTAEELRSILAFVDPCISSEETRYYLNGVYFHPANGVLKVVTTDGHKLALRVTEHAWEGEQDAGIIIPAAAARAVLATLGKKPTGDVEVEIQETGATFKTDKWTINTKHVDCTFPDYTRVIPSQTKEHVTLPLTDTCKALARLSKMAKTGGSPILLDTAEGSLTLRDEDSNTHTLALPKGLRRAGEGLQQRFNSASLKMAFDTFADMGADSLKVSTENAQSPALIRAKGIDGCWVVMPLRY